MKLPLPIYESVKIKDDGQFSVFAGLSKELVEQLKKYSADESDIELQKYTKDRKRFVEGTYEDWYKKDRTPFALVNNSTGEMAAIVRIGPEHLFGDTDRWHTAAWRSYKPWRGKGLMKDFTKSALDFYKDIFKDARFWITARAENLGSIKLAEVLGFVGDKSMSERETKEQGVPSVVMIKQ